MKFSLGQVLLFVTMAGVVFAIGRAFPPPIIRSGDGSLIDRFVVWPLMQLFYAWAATVILPALYDQFVKPTVDYWATAFKNMGDK